MLMAARALDFLVHGAINEPHLPESVFLCALRPEDLDHQEARILGMSGQQPDQSHTHT